MDKRFMGIVVVVRGTIVGLDVFVVDELLEGCMW